MNRVHQIIQKIRNNYFIVSTFKVGAGQFVSQLMSIVSVPILSRIYSDTAYGDNALITSTAAILINIATLGLNSAIMKPEDDEEAKKIFTTAFFANFGICTLFCAICAMLNDRTRLFDISGSYWFALLLMWLYCILSVTNSCLTIYLNRKKQYNKLFFNPIIGSICNFVIAIPLGLLGFGFEGFMITSVFQYLVTCAIMMRGNFPFSRIYRGRDFLRTFVDYKEYILFQYPSNFVGNLGIEYPTQYLGRVFTTTELASYSMCLRVLKIPVRMIAAPISTVYFRTASEYHREEKNLARFTYKMVSKILLVSILPVALFILGSEPLFTFFLGKNWDGAGRIAGFLIIQYVLLFCSQTTSYCRVSIGKQITNLAMSIIRLFIAVASLTTGYLVFHNVEETIFCYSVGQCIFNILDMSVNFYCMDKNYFKKYLLVSSGYCILMYTIYFFRVVFI